MHAKEEKPGTLTIGKCVASTTAFAWITPPGVSTSPGPIAVAMVCS